jgi:DNA-binding response OmpR family regulator
MAEKIKMSFKTGDKIEYRQSESVDPATFYKCKDLQQRLANGTIQQFESELCHRIFKVLVIDDDKEVAGTILSLFQSQGFPNTDVVYSGEDAIKAINKKNYDLVVSDFKLGDMTGQRIFSEVQKQTTIPAFILVSGYDDQHIQALRDCGILVLPKPFNIEQLKTFANIVYLKRLQTLAETTKTILELIKADDVKLILSSLNEGSK